MENTLKKKRRKGMISTGALTDPYVPIEEELRITRRCLQQIERFEFGLSIQTKSNLILRDIDILEKINKKTKCVVGITLTTFDDELCKILEPGVCTTSERVEVLKELKKHGIPTIVWLAPILPYINDTEDNIKGILDYCVEAGVYGIMHSSMGVTFREGSKEYFYEKLDAHFPGMKLRYMENFEETNEYVSPNAEALMKLLKDCCEANNIVYDKEELLRFMREYNNNTMGEQMSIFDF